MKTALYIFLAGGLGTICRYGMSLLPVFKNQIFPYATIAVNIIGSLLIGVLFAYSARSTFIDNNYKLILATGFCGGFTTFSAFSNETIILLKQNNIIGAIVYIFLTFTLSLLATYLGYKFF